MIKFISIGFILLLSTSCNTPKKSISTVSVLAADSLIIPIDSATSSFSSYAKILPSDRSLIKNTECLLFVNNIKNSIQIYNLATKRKIEEIVLPQEGPNSVGKIKGALFINHDSIYVVDDRNLTLSRISTNREVLDKIMLNKYSGTLLNSIPHIENGMEMCIINNKAFIPGNSSYDYNDKKSFYEKGLLCSQIDLKTRSRVNLFPYPFSEKFIKLNYPQQAVVTYCASAGQQLVFSFGCDNNVYKVNLKNNQLQTFLIKSSYVDDIPSPMGEAIRLQDAEKSYIHYLNNTYYGPIFYDGFRQLYYRVVKLKLKEPYSLDKLRKGESVKLKYSLIITDENLNFIDEILLDDNLWAGNILIQKDGILLQTNRSTETAIVFRRFVVNKGH